MLTEEEEIRENATQPPSAGYCIIILTVSCHFCRTYESSCAVRTHLDMSISGLSCLQFHLLKTKVINHVHFFPDNTLLLNARWIGDTSGDRSFHCDQRREGSGAI